MQRIQQAFQRANKEKRCAFIAYLTAGYPSLAATPVLAEALAAAGADIVELGIPFSDPLADGPTIQFSSAQALEKGATTRKILDAVSRLRKTCDVPLVAMGYANPLFHYGLPAFARDAVSAGFDGVVVPDLPPEEAQEWMRAARPRKLATIFLSAPTSPEGRLKRIAACSTGFIYCVSLTGVTGARRQIPKEILHQIHALRRLTRTPLAVGFGVSRPDHVRWLAPLADGVIVGSAIVQAVARAGQKSQKSKKLKNFSAQVKAITHLVKPLVEATRR
ncbi:MAG: tryptophan synthase subunit alpha [Candidatus Omnitrophica bacterium]|nr:tryptophan synthase subunit alpha [Candidatus Omnitrophota bacterium]